MVGKSAFSMWTRLRPSKDCGGGAVTETVKVVCAVPPLLSSAVTVMVVDPAAMGLTVRMLLAMLAVATPGSALEAL